MYHFMRSDIVRVSPLVLFSFLPLTNFVIIPLIYFVPRLLLSSHFWSESQLKQYYVTQYQTKTYEYSVLRRTLMKQLMAMNVREVKFYEILYALENGKRAYYGDFIEFQHLFTDRPFGLDLLTRDHIKSLLKMHEYTSLMTICSKVRLQKHAELLWEADRAIKREGKISHLSEEFLRTVCHLRGFNVSGQSKAQLISWLKDWLKLSTCFQKPTCHSIILHAPAIFNPKY